MADLRGMPLDRVAAGAASDRWLGLRTLLRARLLVAVLALPIGVLMRPEATEQSWWVLFWALLAVGVLSSAFWLGARLRRGLELQKYAQLTSDLALVTWLSARTGARDSQFVLFFALVVITGGLIGRLPGGLFAAVLAGLAILLLPAIAVGLGAAPATRDALPTPWMLLAFLIVMGVLSGMLGQRVYSARRDLARTTMELDRVRVDNDVILRHLTTGVLTVHGNGQVVFVNPAAEQVLGVRGSDLLGRPLAAALPERLDPLRALLQRTLAERSPRARLELEVRTAAGVELPLGISTNPLVHDGEVTGVVAVFQDLTEAHEMERRARRNQTLAEVGALAAGIAHELRNGLHPISGSIEYLQRELEPKGESAVLMNLIVTECSRLNRFVGDLLNYSRERDLAPEPLDLDEHLVETCEVLDKSPRRPEAVRIAFEPGPGTSRVRGDREQLRQVWLNLASNAFEAMPEGGTLAVRRRGDARRAVVVEFADQGGGIAAEDLPRIGQPFYTTKKDGTGLGIAIAQRIVERHGGVLAFESSPGRGTTVRVTLPAAVEDAAQAA